MLRSGGGEEAREAYRAAGGGGRSGVMEAGVDIVWHYRANFPPTGEHCDIGFDRPSPPLPPIPSE